MKRASGRAGALVAIFATLTCMVTLTAATPADAYVPKGAVEVEEVEDLTPIWIFHGDAEEIDDLEKYVIEDNDVRGYSKGEKEIEMLIDGVPYPDGELELSKVITYRAIQAAISQLWPEDVPVREHFEVATGDPSGFSRGTFEYVTRAVSRDAFELDLPPGTSERELTPGNYIYRFTNTETGEEFKTRVLENVWPEGFFELRERVLGGGASVAEREEFDAMWTEVRDTFLTAGEPGDLFHIEEDKESTPVWPIVFTFGLFGLVTVTTVYSVSRGKVRDEY